eukprot:5405474-Lingulodinium_polyedra.AAC.1
MEGQLPTQYANGLELAIRSPPRLRIHDPIKTGPWSDGSTWGSHEDNEWLVRLDILPKISYVFL